MGSNSHIFIIKSYLEMKIFKSIDCDMCICISYVRVVLLITFHELIARRQYYFSWPISMCILFSRLPSSLLRKSDTRRDTLPSNI